MTTAALSDRDRLGVGRGRRHGTRGVPRLALALLAALWLGGGAGTAYPLVALIAQLLALLLLVGAARGQQPTAPDAAATTRTLTWVFAGAAVLLLLQLVPLPPALWHHLPARETAVQLDALVGRAAMWRPLSLTPDATPDALLALIVPFAAMLTVARTTARQRIAFLQLAVLAAAVSTAFAALQVAAGSAGAPILYETAHRGSGVGLFVNRNHQAVFLLAAIAFVAVPGVVPLRAGRGPATAAAAAFLALGVVATGSRTALTLLPISLLVALMLALGVRRSARPLAVVAAVYVIAGALLSRTELAQLLLARFSSIAEDLRYQYWDNALFALRESLPVGTGFGSFVPVYQGVEPLGQVSTLIVNHAHNDYLELVLEGGLPAAALLLAGVVVFALALRRAWRHAGGRQERALIVAGAAAVLLILAFSAVDYPLRMPAIAGLFGACLGLLPAAPRAAAGSLEVRTAPRRLASYAIAGVVGVIACANAFSAYLTLHAQPAAATVLAPWSSAAWTALADEQELASHPAASRRAGLRALAIVPIDPAAVRAVGYADIALGQVARGNALMEAGAALGWRDTLLQLWLAQRAAQAGAAGVMAQRVDALLRRRQFDEPMMAQLRAVYLAPGGPAALVDRLGDAPPWRQGFLNAIADDAAADPARTLAFLAHLRAAGIAATPRETMVIRWRMADRGDITDARRVWLASGGAGTLADGGFETAVAPLPTGTPAYAWGAPALAGVRVVPAEPSGGSRGRTMLIVTDGLAQGTALAQQVALAPGRWRVAARVRGPEMPAAVTVSCRGAAAPLGTLPLGQADGGEASGADRWRTVAGTVTVPPGCASQQVAVVIRPSDGQARSITLDSLAIVAATPR